MLTWTKLQCLHENEDLWIWSMNVCVCACVFVVYFYATHTKDGSIFMYKDNILYGWSCLLAATRSIALCSFSFYVCVTIVIALASRGKKKLTNFFVVGMFESLFSLLTNSFDLLSQQHRELWDGNMCDFSHSNRNEKKRTWWHSIDWDHHCLLKFRNRLFPYDYIASKKNMFTNIKNWKVHWFGGFDYICIVYNGNLNFGMLQIRCHRTKKWASFFTL